MRIHMNIAIAIATLSLFALIFWQAILDTTGKDAAVADTQQKFEYVVTPNPYLPVKRIEPVW